MTSSFWLVKFLIQLLVLMTFGLAAWGKIKEWKTPEWFINQFSNTWIAKLPGGPSVGYRMILVLESVVALLMVWSIVRGEYQVSVLPEVLSWGLSLAMSVFVALGFGLRLTGDFQGAANLYSYFGVTLLAWAVVQRLGQF